MLIEDFNVEVSVGLVYDKAGVIVINTGDDDREISTIFQAFEERLIRIAVQHLPLNPPNTLQWGGGCCFWEPSGECPFGHHEEPNELYAEVLSGVLKKTDQGWSVGEVEIKFNWLVGHRCRLMLVTEFSPPTGNPDISDLKGLEDELSLLREKLTQIKDQ